MKPNEMETEAVLTESSLALFVRLAEDAENWNGEPIVVLKNKSEKGNLTDLKTKGLISTEESDNCLFAFFTESGVDLARKHGINCTYWHYIKG